MSYYVRVGELPRKRHMRTASPQGGLLVEELVGQEGFAGASSLLYHLHSPAALLAVEPMEQKRQEVFANQPLVPWHVRAGEIQGGGDLVESRTVLFANDQVSICWVRAEGPSRLYRNGAGDELVYVQSGSARYESVFGAQTVGAGDYLRVPAGSVSRWVPLKTPLEALVIESVGHLDLPRRYLAPCGQLREGAPFCERDLKAPTEPLVASEDGPAEVVVRTRSGWSLHRYAHHPFDVVGWDGYVWPLVFNIKDFEPLVGRNHQPPPVHQTFEGPGVVVCSFVPRPLDFDPEALKVPYHHSNTDCDEVIFYSSGEFSSRRGSGIGPTSLTLHPAGFVHGPQPGAAEAALGESRTEETAVMVDTFSALGVSVAAREVADAGYWRSWAGLAVGS